jgi:hypothetical protein
MATFASGFTAPDGCQAGTRLAGCRCPVEQSTESSMAGHTKRDFWFITLSTITAAPFIACVGLVAVSGIIAW